MRSQRWLVPQKCQEKIIILVPSSVTLDIEDASVVVTGAARGIGRGIALALLERGARVTICSLHEETLAAAHSELGPHGALTGVVADVSTAAGCNTVVEHALARHGGVAAIVANAGRYGAAPPQEETESNWDMILAANLKSAFFSVQAALPYLREARGTAVFVSSVNGLIGRRDAASAYAAAKGGLIALTKHLALELAPSVRVNCIAPGFTETERTARRPPEWTAALAASVPLERIGARRDIAAAIIASMENDYMTGAVIPVDGGLSAGH